MGKTMAFVARSWWVLVLMLLGLAALLVDMQFGLFRPSAEAQARAELEDYRNEVERQVRIKKDEKERNYQKRLKEMNELFAQHEQKIPANMKDGSFVWLLFPPLWQCDTEERIGNLERFANMKNDGAKWMCPSLVPSTHNPYYQTIDESRTGPCLMYSFGVNDNVLFDIAFHERFPDCEIHAFDPTTINESVIAELNNDAKATYHQWGLAPKNSGHAEYKSLQEIMRDLNHVNRTIDVLKIDIERGEFHSLPDFLGDGILPTQILIEIHWWGWEGLVRLVQLLEHHGYRMTHAENNPWTNQAMEYVFILYTP